MTKTVLEPVIGVRRGADHAKAIEVLLYITQRVRDMYTALKVIYFADRIHLDKYGRLLYGDRYIAMSHGPVPSLAYDIIKGSEGYLGGGRKIFGSDFFSMSQNDILARRAPNIDLISQSDIEALEAAIRIYSNKTFEELKSESHDAAWESADRNDNISFEALVRSLPSGEELLEHISNG
jgi:uncharacterized phage-associated protein